MFLTPTNKKFWKKNRNDDRDNILFEQEMGNSITRDIGAALGTGGYLADLERTRVGQFRKETAVRLEDINMLN